MIGIKCTAWTFDIFRLEENCSSDLTGISSGDPKSDQKKIHSSVGYSGWSTERGCMYCSTHMVTYQMRMDEWELVLLILASFVVLECPSCMVQSADIHVKKCDCCGRLSKMRWETFHVLYRRSASRRDHPGEKCHMYSEMPVLVHWLS